MIIEKVFSNIEEPEETLYSVLMTEEEMKMFAVNPVRNLIRKVGRDAKMTVNATKAGFKMGARKELNPTDVHTIAVNNRFIARKMAKTGKPGFSGGQDGFKKLSPKEATKLAQDWSVIDRAGKGATPGIFGGYNIPR